MDKQSYRNTFDAIKGIFIEFDPLGLIAGGAPEDEYDLEISTLIPQLRTCHSLSDVADSIRAVLSDLLDLHDLPADVVRAMSEKVLATMTEAD
jgi:hypothetical protein